LKTFGFLEPRKRLRNDSKRSTKFLLGKRGDAVKEQKQRRERSYI